MSETSIDIVIMIPTHYRNELLERTLSSLSECNLPENYTETVIIENGGKFGAEDIVNKFKDSLNTRYLFMEEGNKSMALNHALEGMEKCFVFFTDDDIRFDNGILNVYASAIEGVTKGMFFGGAMGVDYETEPEEWRKVFLPHSAKGWGYDGNPEAVVDPVLLGCNWAAFSDDLKKSGGFDPAFGPGSKSGSSGQEARMQSKLLDMGVKGKYLPKAIVWHYVPENRCSTEWSLERSYKVGTNYGMRLENKFSMFGFPASLLYQWLLSRGYYMLTHVFGSKQERFRARYYAKHIDGQFKGYKIKKKGLPDYE